ncbi:MAG TPA: PD-(D/E)XK nuclease family protein [Thermoanaerobaculia bacterium]
MRKLVRARAADRRLAIARELIGELDGEIVVIGASRGAADDFVRAIAAAKPATFGIHRFSLAQFASRVSRLESAREGVSPAASLMVDAVIAHSAHERASANALHYFHPVARLAGFPKAVRDTLSELRQAGVDRATIAQASTVGPDLAALLDGFEASLDSFAISDITDLYLRATRVFESDPPSFARQTVVFLDLPVRTNVVEQFIAAIIGSAARVVAVEPADDEESCAAFVNAGCEVLDDDGGADTALNRVRRNLFAAEVPEGASDETVRFFSAPGEGREAVEIARAIVAEVDRGVRFDEIAVLLRNPSQYAAQLASAFRRASIPVHFAQGARRPDPSGRAFLALLTCGAEDFSARRFAEYLSLGQVPREPDTTSAPTAPEDEALLGLLAMPSEEVVERPEGEEAALREPWKWEELVIEAAVLGGADRWARRLAGLESEYYARLRNVVTEDPAAPQADALRRDIKRLTELRAFAIPIIAELQSLRDAATWQAWIARLEALARRTLKSPGRVLRALADLRPMGDIGPVTFADVISVLTERLNTLELPQNQHRYGAVFVAPIDSARGFTFRTVFVPGVAERAFPQRPREDPLLPDRMRAEVSDALILQNDRAVRERLLLQLAAGAASERLVVSYPRMEVREGRPRVSSFYALDVLRAVNGHIPDYKEVEAQAQAEAGAMMAWPAPDDARDAIDALEYDLATLRPLLLHPDPEEVTGRANYLVKLHPMLDRALRTRRARWKDTWVRTDGLVVKESDGIAAVLSELSLRVRAYSPSALQHYAACPYRFYLSAILRLRTREEPERIEALDPNTRGTLVHEIYATVLRTLQSEGSLPLTPDNLPHARNVADHVMDDVVRRAYEELAPAVDLVWETSIASIRTDMHIWLGQLTDTADQWLPVHFELGFGIETRPDLDASSNLEPTVLDEGFRLRGSIDLVERSMAGDRVRIRDYKTGSDPSRKKDLVVGGGKVLQPMLYALVAEKLLSLPAREGQLWFATSRGDFRERTVPVTGASRRDVTDVLNAIDDAVTTGFLPAAPGKDECERCEFIRVCGPYEEIRAGRKSVLEELVRIRELK